MAVTTTQLIDTSEYTLFRDVDDVAQTVSLRTVFKAGSPEDNQAGLLAKAGTALTNNQTFLAIGAPTQAQAVAQVQALTRQVNALIRLQIGQLDTTAGT